MLVDYLSLWKQRCTCTGHIYSSLIQFESMVQIKSLSGMDLRAKDYCPADSNISLNFLSRLPFQVTVRVCYQPNKEVRFRQSLLLVSSYFSPWLLLPVGSRWNNCFCVRMGAWLSGSGGSPSGVGGGRDLARRGGESTSGCSEQQALASVMQDLDFTKLFNSRSYCLNERSETGHDYVSGLISHRFPTLN